MEQTRDAARLAREIRVWRAVACALAVLVAPAGIALGQDSAPAPAATVRLITVLEVPPDPKLKIIGGRIEQDLPARKMVVSGGVTVPSARVSFDRGGKPGTRRITVEP